MNDRHNNRKYMRTNAEAILTSLGGAPIMETAASATLRHRTPEDTSVMEAYATQLEKEAADFIADLFRSPETQKTLRAACRKALSDAIAAVLEAKRAELESDVALLIAERWQADVEQVAQAVLAEELGKIKRRLTGGGA